MSLYSLFSIPLYSPSRKHVLPVLLLLSIALAMRAAVPTPLLLTADEFQYLGAAKNIAYFGQMRTAAGTLFTHWAPIMPILFSPVYFFSGNPLIYVAAFLTGTLLAFVLSLYLFMYRTTNSAWVAALTTVTVLLLRPTLVAFSSAGSESVFLILMALYFTAFVRWQETTKRSLYYWFLMLGSSMVLTRYAGLFIVFGAAAYVFLQKKSTSSRRWSAVIAAMSALVTYVLWKVLVAAGDVSASQALVSYHGLSFKDVLFASAQVGESLTHLHFGTYSISALIGLTFISVFLIWSYQAVRQSLTERERSTIRLLSMTGVVYLAGLFFTYAFIYRTASLSARLVLPAIICFVCIAFVLMRSLFQRMSKSYPRYGLIMSVPLVILTVMFVYSSRYTFQDIRRAIVREQLFIHSLRSLNLSEYRSVYSNMPTIPFFVSDQPILPLPLKFEERHFLPNAMYSNEVDRFMTALQRGDAIVYVRYFGTDSRAMSEEELQKNLTLRPLSESETYALYSY